MYGQLAILSYDREITDFCCAALQNLFSDIVFSFTVEDPTLILLDFALICANDFAVLNTLVSRYADCPILVLSRMIQPMFAVKTIKSGACDFLPFPCSNNFLQRKVREYLACTSVHFSNNEVTLPIFDELIGNSPKMLSLKKQLFRAAEHDEPVLLLGESGTGKNLAARLVHDVSKRQGKPFFELNVSSISESIASGELFGSDRGAYTGSVLRSGFFECAHTGTLFLDEIGELSGLLQLKLLHVVENGSFYRLGSTHIRKCDVRLICATNADLRSSIKNKTFREDLYYRLAVFPFEIPPLRERKEDIGLLAAFFLKQSGKKISVPALQKLRDHNWPGNVRELHNCMRRASLSRKSAVIDASDIVFC